MAKPKKIKLADSTKKKIKNNFENYTKKQVKRLSPEGQRYYQILQASKQSADNRSGKKKEFIEIDGKKYTGKLLVDLVKDTAKEKNKSIKQVIKQMKPELLDMAKHNYDLKNVRPDKLIDQIERFKGKYVYINDGDGVTRYSKKKAIEQIALFQNFVRSETTAMEIGIPKRTYFKDGHIEISMPTYEQYGDEDFSQDEIESMLDDLDIFHIDSPKGKKK